MRTREQLAASLPQQGFTSTYLDPDDNFDDDLDLVDDWLAHGTGSEMLDKVQDRFWESRAAGVDDEVGDCARRMGLDGVLDLEVAEENELREMLCEIDDFDPLDQMLTRTRCFLAWRVPVDIHRLAEDAVPGAWDGRRGGDAAFAARCTAVATALESIGADTSVLGDRIEQLVANGPYDWPEWVGVEVFWHGSPAGLSAGGGEVGIEVHAPFVCLIDRLQGTGMEMELDQVVRMRATTDNPVVVDSEHGYGLDSICGLVAHPFRAEPRVLEAAGA